MLKPPRRDPGRVNPRWSFLWESHGLLAHFGQGYPYGEPGWGIAPSIRGTYADGRFGRGLEVTGATVASGHIDTGNHVNSRLWYPFITAESERTIAVLANLDAPVNTYAPLCFVQNVGNNNGWAIQSAGGNEGLRRFNFRVSMKVNGTIRDYNPVTFYADGEPRWFVLRWKSGTGMNFRIYTMSGEVEFDGTDSTVLTGTENAWADNTSSNNRFMIGAGPYGYSRGHYDALIFTPYYLTDSDLAELAGDPFGPWRMQERRVAFAVGATGGGSTILPQIMHHYYEG